MKLPDVWFGLKYNMNLYYGCQHQGIYCDSRSLCYGIENFAHIQVKENASDLLRKVLASKRANGTIGTGFFFSGEFSMGEQYFAGKK